jgi:hypothetical protein
MIPHRSRIVSATLMLLLGACSQGPVSSFRQHAADLSLQKSQFEITATIRELMDSTVDPAADGLWNSVASISSKAGMEERQPRTDEEWAAVRRHAVTLMESMNLVVMKGRRAAPPGTQPGEGELTPDEIDQRIAANREALVSFAKALRFSTQGALSAIDKKDVAGLFKAGGEIDEACEGCHIVFWYPDQKLPSTSPR